MVEAVELTCGEEADERLLMGLRLAEGVAFEVLEGMGVDLETLSAELRGQMERGAVTEPTSEIAFTPEAERMRVYLPLILRNSAR